MRKLRPKVEAMVFLIASCPAEQLTELVHLERKILVRISTMKVSCESVLKELVWAMTVKCHAAYSPLYARGNNTRRARFFFRSSFLRGSLNLNRLPIADGHL